MVKINCPECQRQRSFTEKEKNKYVCETCNITFGQCIIKECSNLIKHGLVCKSCVSKGAKNGGSVGLSALAIGGILALKALRKGK